MTTDPALASLLALDPAAPVPAAVHALAAPENRHLLEYVREDPFGAHVFPGNIEGYDPEQKAPVIRVLYGNLPLPIFDGQPLAIIDPQADRETLWGAIIDRIRAGAFDAQIEAVAGEIYGKTLKPKAAA